MMPLSNKDVNEKLLCKEVDEVSYMKTQSSDVRVMWSGQSQKCRKTQYTYSKIVTKTVGTFTKQENNAIGQHAWAFRLEDSSKVLQSCTLTLDIDGDYPLQKLDKQWVPVVQNGEPHISPQVTESLISPPDNVADDSKTAPFEYCAVRWSNSHHFNDSDCTHRTQPSSIDAFHGQLQPQLKIESLLNIPSYLLAYSVVGDSLCDNLLFGVKFHSR
ncbi:hypothetical protein TNCV_1849911 [Trichonephila clavipes]|nr:hypothetical protein TNCV_1849911 [Trichonephila clavipes]